MANISSACCLLLMGALISSTNLYANDSSLVVGDFSDNDVYDQLHPAGWNTLAFPGIERHTDYELVNDEDIIVVRASSRNAASALVKRVKINLHAYPIVQWRWKISNVYKTADAYSKQGDDYPARLYLVFDYDINELGWFDKFKYEMYHTFYGEYPPLAVLNYLWESRLPKETLIPNVFSQRVKMIVVRSGDEQLDTWVVEERNVYKDYLRAFGEEPRNINAVAIMSDSDNTGESTVAHYGDIRFLKAKSGK